MKVCEGCKERTYNFFLNFGCKTMLLLNYVNEKMYCVHVVHISVWSSCFCRTFLQILSQVGKTFFSKCRVLFKF